MKKMRKISTVLLALIVALAMSAAAFGETGGISEDAAVKMALKDANTSASGDKRHHPGHSGRSYGRDNRGTGAAPHTEDEDDDDDDDDD